MGTPAFGDIVRTQINSATAKGNETDEDLPNVTRAQRFALDHKDIASRLGRVRIRRVLPDVSCVRIAAVKLGHGDALQGAFQSCAALALRNRECEVLD